MQGCCLNHSMGHVGLLGSGTLQSLQLHAALFLHPARLRAIRRLCLQQNILALPLPLLLRGTACCTMQAPMLC
jgi:hypothetical protein